MDEKSRPRKLLPLALAAPLLMLWACGGSSSGTQTNTANYLLQGTCVWQNLSLATTQSGAGPATILALLTFDGKGHTNFDYYVNINGTFSSTPSVTGTYQMDANRHGWMNYVSPASSNNLTFDLQLSESGNILHVQTQSYFNQPTTPRVSSGQCRFNE